MNPENSDSVTRSQLVLWNYNTNMSGTLSSFLNPQTKLREDGTVKSMSVSVVKKTDIKKATGLTKDDLTHRELEIKDDLKEAMGKEFVGLVASELATGHGVRITFDKDGFRTWNFILKEVKAGRGPSVQDIAKAYGMSVEQVRDMIRREKAKLAADAEADAAKEAAKVKVVDPAPEDPAVKPEVKEETPDEKAQRELDAEQAALDKGETQAQAAE